MRRFITILTALCMLTACGGSRLERAGSGAVMGAGTGMMVGYAASSSDSRGNGIEAGLFIGMAVGALIGYLLEEPILMNSR